MVTIVIPLYNYSNYIKECLESCPRPDGSGLEIIVVDDCSTDHPEYYLDWYAKRNTPGFRWFRNPKNMGYSYSKNVGIVKALGEYIVHLDADDMLTSWGIAARLAVFKDDIDMVHGFAERYRDGKLEGINHSSAIHAQGVMIRRSVYERYGLYYEPLRSMSDKEMWYRLGIHPESPLPRLIKDRKTTSVVAWYRKHDLQMHKVRRQTPEINKQIKAMFKRRIKQLEKRGITTENTRFIDDN